MARDPFANYDSWLEAPYQSMCEEQDRFVDWCEAADLDPDGRDSEQQYADYCQAQDEAQAEAYAEAMADRYEDDWDDFGDEPF